VEYYRASGETAALEEALALYHGLQQKAHDRKHGGWIEHFQADWTPILAPSPAAAVEVAGYKSANTHLHLMEAFTELYETSRDARVRQSLEEALRLNRKYFYPPKPGRSCFHRRLDWSEVTDPASAGLSYGHNVEFAWLMIRAQQVLGRKPAWTHFHAHLDHALKFGYDPDRGGLYNRGFDDQPATQRDKIWWVQAEMLAALTDAMKHRPRPAYAEALESLLHFIRRHQADDRDGVWFDTVGPDGTPKNRAKAHNWKANYHDVRALVKFVEAFEGAGASPNARPPRHRSGLKGKQNGEGRALLRLALDADGSVVLFDDPPGNGQPKTRPALFGGEKGLEQPAQPVGRNPHAGILNGDTDAAGRAGGGVRIGRHRQVPPPPMASRALSNRFRNACCSSYSPPCTGRVPRGSRAEW
jgi:mannose/cellobiose epimerase-like protein (N-acyl-D-glucosamine 2-epimerase family)